MGSNYAGVDWASEKHDVLIADEAGEELLAASFSHDEKELRSLCGALVRAKVDLVAIERPDGVLVERLLGAGLRVLALHPNQVAAARPRFRAAGGKSDRFDSFVLCELARTDHHRFRVLEPDRDETKALRALTRGRDDLVQARVALANQLRAELERCWPGATRIFAKLDSPIALAFLQRYPSPTDAKALAEKRLAAFLAKHGYSGGKTAAQLLAKLRAAPEGCAGEIESQARRAIVLALVAALGPLVAQIKALDRQIAQAVREHPDGAIFLSLFKDPGSVVTAATLLGEIGEGRAGYPTREALAGDAGQGAVAVESGKRKVACLRWACNQRLRSAFCTLADSTRHWHPWAADHYARAIGRGHDHPRATRTLGRAWCRIVWRCWQDGVPYDPARHRGLQQHIAVTVPTTSGPRPDIAATRYPNRRLTQDVSHPRPHRGEVAIADDGARRRRCGTASRPPTVLSDRFRIAAGAGVSNGRSTATHVRTSDPSARARLGGQSRKSRREQSGSHDQLRSGQPFAQRRSRDLEPRPAGAYPGDRAEQL